jgi:hypothetical protein
MIVWAVATYETLVPIGEAWVKSSPHTRGSIETAPDIQTAIAQSKADALKRRAVFSDDPTDPYRVIKKPTFREGKLASCTVVAKEVRAATPADTGEFVFRFMVRYTKETDMGHIIVEKGNTRPFVGSVMATSLDEARTKIAAWYQSEAIPNTEIVKTEEYIVI